MSGPGAARRRADQAHSAFCAISPVFGDRPVRKLSPNDSDHPEKSEDDQNCSDNLVEAMDPLAP